MPRKLFAVCGAAMTAPKRFVVSMVMLELEFGGVSMP
jgi:hypothetical protein